MHTTHMCIPTCAHVPVLTLLLLIVQCSVFMVRTSVSLNMWAIYTVLALFLQVVPISYVHNVCLCLSVSLSVRPSVCMCVCVCLCQCV